MKYYRTDKRLTRGKIQENPNVLYLFGDNTIRKGLGGQAKEMRGESNTIGIITKRYPSNKDTAFFCDFDYNDFVELTNQGFIDVIEYIVNNRPIAVVEPPLGVGLADLPNRAPRCYEYLRLMLDKLKFVIENFY